LVVTNFKVPNSPISTVAVTTKMQFELEDSIMIMINVNEFKVNKYYDYDNHYHY